MSIRERVNQNSRLSIALAVIVTCGAIAMAVYQLSDPGERVPTRAWFTVDDGATWFADTIDRVPPFEHQGKMAVRAYLFRCGGDPFVGWLARYNDKGKIRMEKYVKDKSDAIASGKPESGIAPIESAVGMEIKRPGDARWILFAGDSEIMTVKCPSGKIEDLEVYLP